MTSSFPHARPGTPAETRHRAALCLAAFLAFLAWPASGQTQPRFTLEGWYWRGDLEATALVNRGTLGTVFDFKRDLGMSDAGTPAGRFVLALGPHSRLHFSYLDLSYRGDATVERTIEFAGHTYTVGTRVVSSLGERYGRAGWVWQFVDVGDGAFRLGTVLDVVWLRLAAALRAPDLQPPEQESDTLSGTLPALGLAVDASPHRALDLFLEGSGVDAGSHGSLLDAEAGLRVFPTANLGVLAAYRVLDLRLNDRPDFAKVRVAGPYLGLSARW